MTPTRSTRAPTGACPASEADQPNSPSFDAGTVSPTAGAFTPFVLQPHRETTAPSSSPRSTTSPPPGLVAKLAGTPSCSEAQIAQAQARSSAGDGASEQAAPSCPAASKVGTVDVARERAQPPTGPRATSTWPAPTKAPRSAS